eukprot:7246995-Pyramimonas_sp.AAC.1
MGVCARKGLPDRAAELYERMEVSWSPTIGHMKRGYVLMTDQSDAGSAGMFSQRTHQTQEVR